MERRRARRAEEGALVYRFEGPLFFGVASTIFDALQRIDPSPLVYVIDFRMVPFIDSSAAESSSRSPSRLTRKEDGSWSPAPERT